MNNDNYCGWVVIHKNGTIKEISPEASNLLAVSSESIRKLNFYEIVQPDLMVLLNHSMKNNDVFSCKTNLVKSDGTAIPVEISEVNCFLQNIERVFFIKPIGNNKNNSNTDFHTIIAHDLRGPLGTFLSMSQFLHEKFDVLSEEKKKIFVNQIYIQSLKTYNLLNDLIDWSNKETGKVNLKLEKLDILGLINETIRDHSVELKKKEISINTNIEDNPFIQADKNSIKLILRNLLTNAIKFTPHNGFIVIRNKITDKKLLELSILNLNEQVLTDRKQLLKGKINESRIGTNGEIGKGLGLVLCKEFIELNGGNLEIESGKNTTDFSFTVPLWNPKVII